MNIDKALEHIKWKFDNVAPPTEKDLESFNAILDYKEKQEDINLEQNENLAKLWVHTLMMLNVTNLI